MEWTNEIVLHFLEEYQAEPSIWDPQHPDHRIRTRVSDAWQRLHKSLNINCTLSELKKKKDSLMASFRMLLNKKKKNIKSGMSNDELFKPNWFAFETMEKFLAPVYHCTPTINTETYIIQAEAETQSESGEGMNENDNEGEIGEVSDISEDTTRDTPNSTPSQNSVEIQNIFDTTSSATPKRVNIIKEDPGISAPEKPTEEAFNIVKDASMKANREREEDECTLYGNLLAKKLRKFDEQEREEIMLEIDTLLLKKRKLKSIQISSSPYMANCSTRPSATQPYFTQSSSLTVMSEPLALVPLQTQTCTGTLIESYQLLQNVDDFTKL